MRQHDLVVARARRLLLGLLWVAVVGCDSPGDAATAASASQPAPLPEAVVSDEYVRHCSGGDEVPLASLTHYVGAMHEHSSYSDGDIHSVPADYYRAIQEAGYDYAAGADHSDTLDPLVFISLGSDCFSTPDGFLTCLTPSADTLFKWHATAQQAQAATSNDFLALRGFEWTSDRFGHIGVYLSSQIANAKTDLGYLVTMETFWRWFTRAPNMPGLGGSALTLPPFGGGADGLGVFHHPSDKCLSSGDRGCNWNDFALVPGAVERMFGMELYNGARSGSTRYMADFVRALGKGWRLSPVAGEDEHGSDYAADSLPKTVTLASSLDEAGFRQAWLARRTYALAPGWQHLRAALTVDGSAPMGAQLDCDASRGAVPLQVRVSDAEQHPLELTYHLFGSGGEIVASATGQAAHFELPVVAGQARWYFVRVDAQDEPVAYLAPVWIQGR